MDSTAMKRCSKCGRERTLDKFARAQNSKDGHMGVCKLCYSLNNMRRLNYRNKNGKNAILFTIEDWERALDYFGYKCAVCGSEWSANASLELDHWIPITSPRYPNAVPWNIIPLCSLCNRHKMNHHPFDWLISRHGPRRAAKIITRIEAFFATVRQTELTPKIGES